MKDALSRIPSKVEDLIESHAKELEDAWANTGEGTLAISFPVKIGIKNGKQVCEVGISFVMEKCQDSTIFEWDDRQGNLLKMANHDRALEARK
jgi:hypothetical protein